MYKVSGTVVHHTTDGHGLSQEKTIQIPDFFLDENMLGIVDEDHAIEIARTVVCPVELQYEGVTLHLDVNKVN